MRSLLGLILATAAGFLVVAAMAVGWLAFASLPQLSGEAILDGLAAPVRISRDARGIPLIEAEGEVDAAMALGFVHAQDRLWQMEVSRRVGAGRLAEVVGEAGLGSDRFMRVLGLYRAAEAALEHLSPEAVRRLEAYAAGVNAVIARPWWRLPPEFHLLRHRPEPWRPADSLVLIKTMALSLVESWRGELTRAAVLDAVPAAALGDLWPPPRPDAVVTIADAGGPAGASPRASSEPPPRPLPDGVGTLAQAMLAVLPGNDEHGLGSNIWAIGGAHTASGAALLANDPHLGLTAPAPWYLAALRTDEGLVMGATLPALPVVVIGRNAQIAWGFTNTGGDTEDLFVERIDPGDERRYLTPDGSEAFELRDERIVVRGAEDAVLRVRESRHGPVISDVLPAAAAAAGEGHVLALRWTALQPDDRTLEAGLALARAGDFAAFRDAVDHFLNPTQNAFYADRDGRIGVRLAGRLPDRAAGDGSLPVPGWTGNHDWRGLLPATAHPEMVNSPSGYMLNANNRLVDAGFPHVVTAHWNDDLRARRIEAVLAEAIALGEPLDLAQMQRLQLDKRSMMAVDFLPLLLAVEASDAQAAEILDAMAAWDGESRAGAPEPLIFQAWYRALVAAVFGDELGASFAAYRGIRSDALRHVLEAAPDWCDDRSDTAAVQDCRTMAAAAFAVARRELETTWGSDWRRWRWGEASGVRMPHRPLDSIWGLRALFSLGAVGGGDAGTVDVARYSQSDPYATVAAASLRVIADLAEPAALHVVLPTGQSGHPLSRHYADQRDDWANGGWHHLNIASDAWEPRHIMRLLPPGDGVLAPASDG